MPKTFAKRVRKRVQSTDFDSWRRRRHICDFASILMRFSVEKFAILHRHYCKYVSTQLRFRVDDFASALLRICVGTAAIFASILLRFRIDTDANTCWHSCDFASTISRRLCCDFTSDFKHCNAFVFNLNNLLCYCVYVFWVKKCQNISLKINKYISLDAT
jgi:hypothetical protein